MRTASFKLAALYVLIFGISVVALAAVVYVISTTAMDRQTRARIQSETQELAADYRAGGLAKLLGAIHARQQSRLAGGLEYTVFDSSGQRAYGDLRRAPVADGWSEQKGPPDGDEAPGVQEHLVVYSMALGDGVWLMVGDDIGKVRATGRLIMTAFGWALLAMVTLAVGGGVALSAAFLGRIESITRAAEAIIGGDIRQRMPMRGIGDDIDRLSATLNRMLDRISVLMDSLKQVSSDIAHDLRTPLGRLRHSLDEARRNAHGTADYEAAVDRALLEADDILDTFAAILRIAQIESGSRRAGFRVLDLSALVTSIAHTYMPVAEDEGCQLSVHVAPAVALQGDRELLMQMLANLIENAIRHGDGGAIAVSLSAGRDGPVLRVADRGPGIPASEYEAVLRRFYRLERSRTTPGNGLGLNLVAAVVELHGARIELGNNNPGLAVTVRFAPSPKPEAQPAMAEATTLAIRQA